MLGELEERVRKDKNKSQKRNLASGRQNTGSNEGFGKM